MGATMRDAERFRDALDQLIHRGVVDDWPLTGPTHAD
jgi:hypothetical protein